MSLFGTKTTKTGEQATTKKAADKKPADKKADAKKSVSMQDLYADAKPRAKAGEKTAVASSKHQDAYRILIKPLITEKATDLSAANKYVFMIAPHANKIEVAKAIKAVYGIKPTQVNLINIPGKRVSRGRISGRRSDRRKAIVTLPKGETIKIYEGV